MTNHTSGAADLPEALRLADFLHGPFALDWTNEAAAELRRLQSENQRLAAQAVAPIDMVLHCPACGLQHVDAADPPITVLEAVLRANPLAMPAPQRWENPPHRSHLCHGCGHIWRPADVPTNGVQAVVTTGKADSPIAATRPAPPAMDGGDAVDAPLSRGVIRDVFMAHGFTVKEGQTDLKEYVYDAAYALLDAARAAQKEGE